MKLLFIISQPRSGSTLVQSIMSNSDRIDTASEPWVLLPFLGFFEPGLHQARYNQNLMTKAVTEFVNNSIGSENFKERIKDLLQAFYKGISSSESNYVLDKTPRYYEILNQIKEFFPEAKFIILKRNPYSVVHSILTTWNIFTLEKLLEYRNDLLRAPTLIQGFIDSHRGDPNVIEVKYEDIVSDPEGKFGMLYSWLSIPFHRDLLHYSENKKYTGIFGDQLGIKKHGKPSVDSLDSWKTLQEHRFWSQFIKGYSAYLGENFMKRYGDYETLSQRQTDEFKYFLFICSRVEDQSLNPIDEMHALRRLIYFNGRFGSAKRRRPLIN
jgi:hypothetical protein